VPGESGVAATMHVVDPEELFGVRVYLVGYIFCIIYCHIYRDIFGSIDIIHRKLSYISVCALPLNTLILYIYRLIDTM
jgi:hypothetical protein